MAISWLSDSTRWHQCRKKRGIFSRKWRFAENNTQLLILAIVFATLVGSRASVEEPKQPQSQPNRNRVYIAGSLLLEWRDRYVHTKDALAQLESVNQCFEGVNARVDTELFESDLMHFCKRKRNNGKIFDFLPPITDLVAPSEQQMTHLCREDSCATWLRRVVHASWLPECRYRQSQVSVRSLAETLVYICEDLGTTGKIVEFVAPNATVFREIYNWNQFSNLVRKNRDTSNEVKERALVARQLLPQADFQSVGSENSSPLHAAQKDLTDTAESNSFISSRSVSPGLGNSSTTTEVLNELSAGSDSNFSDAGGFTSSDVRPHASLTATTTELTLSYVYVIGAWVFFNGSYFFLMRRK